MHTIFRNFSRNIHVSCCLFSHKKNKTNKHQIVRVAPCYLKFVLFCIDLITYRTVVRQNKKNIRHTCMHTIFRNFPRQYSRRLLSILAQLNVYPRTTITIGLNISSLTQPPILFNNFRKMFSELSKRNDDHVFIRFAWMCFVNERHNIFRLTFFSQRYSSSLRKKMLIMLSCASRVR